MIKAKKPEMAYELPGVAWDAWRAERDNCRKNASDYRIGRKHGVGDLHEKLIQALQTYENEYASTEPDEMNSSDWQRGYVSGMRDVRDYLGLTPYGSTGHKEAE